MNRLALTAAVALALVACEGLVEPEGPLDPPRSGIDDPMGPVGNPDQIFPSGQTLRGSYSVDFLASMSDHVGSTSWFYSFKLDSPPQAHFIAKGAAAPAECPGTGEDPQADPGHLCVYEVATNSNTTGKIICSEWGCPSSADWGAWLLAQAIGSGPVLTSGTWAVTGLPAS